MKLRLRVLVSVVLAIAATACPAYKTSTRSGVVPSPSPAQLIPGTVLLDGSPSVYLAVDDELPREVVLQVRSSIDGHLVRVLLREKDWIEAVRAPDGSVIATIQEGCRTDVKRIDGRTGQIKDVRMLNEQVFEPSVSPDGKRLAYATKDQCLKIAPGVSTPHSGLPQFLPSTLAIIDLDTGARVATSTSSRGNPLDSLSWSPNGTELAAHYAGDQQQILIFDPAHPSFASARRITASRSCGYLAPVWTRSGIVAVEGCGPDIYLSSMFLVRISVAGSVEKRWPLPACIDGIGTIVDNTYANVLVNIHIGYGNGSCAKHWINHVDSLVNDRLRTRMQTVFRVPATQGNLNPVDW